MENITELIDRLLMGNGIIIAAAAYVLAEIIKVSLPALKRFIPLIGGVVGILLGVLVPSIFEGSDPLSAAVMGMALGWAATGAFETIKSCRKDEIG